MKNTSNNEVVAHGIYRHSCINCDGETSDDRLYFGLPCSKCYPIHVADVLNNPPSEVELYEVMKKLGTLNHYRRTYMLRKKLEELEKLFNKATNSRLWSAQRTWAIRVFKGVSFAIVAPTGVGKTLFGIIMAIYNATKGRKSYIILPTTPLVLQVYDRIKELAEKAKVKVDVLTYHARLSQSVRREVLDRISKGEFNILVTTSKFLSKRFEYVKDVRFNFIFVDDVDAILKSSKNIDRILILLGFTQEDVDKAYKLVKLKNTIVKALRSKEDVSSLIGEAEKLRYEVEKSSRKVKSVLIVSSATGKARGLRVRVFKELLGFDIGSRSELLRNIVDSYVKVEPKDLEETVVSIVKKLGTGGLVYVPVDKGLEYAEKIAGMLREANVNAEVFKSGRLKVLDAYVGGEVDVLVGVATYYGVLVRGLDLPERVRYAVFAGVPRFKFSAKFEEPHPINILRALLTIRETLSEEEKGRIDKYVTVLRRLVQTAPTTVLDEIKERLIRGEKPKSYYERVASEALSFLKAFLADPSSREKLSKLPDVSLVEENGTLYILIPDIMTYIQASGRTSRMFVGGITKGLSVVVAEDPKLLNGLIKRSKFVIEDIEWQPFNNLDVEALVKEIDDYRVLVRKILSGEITVKLKDPIKTALLIVESPNKARTIARFFGKPSVRSRGPLRVYEVSTGDLVLMITASGGHMFDLVTDTGFHGVLTPNEHYTRGYLPVYTSIRRCLSCGYQFSDDLDSCPKCGSRNIRSQLETLELIRDIALEVDKVLIGTDPDTEGEKIGWDIAVLLRPYTKSVERIEFHEVTKRAIIEALKSSRDFNRSLVEAQIVRRVEDRWIGFELSQRLWRAFGKHWLSAGRVQTPVLGWVINRYDEWRKSRGRVFIVKLPYNITVELWEVDFKGVDLSCVETYNFKITPEEVSVETLNPPPPYTTDKMIEEASNSLKLGASQIMQIAQDLFELGLITYHRTDSTRVSPTGINIAREYLKEAYGEEFESLFKPRSWGEGGAHECIRPTRPISAQKLRDLIVEGVITPVKPLTKHHYALYNMIFERFIASQMVPAKIRKQKVHVRCEELGIDWVFERIIDLIDEGFNRILKFVKVESSIDKEVIVRPLEVKVVKRSKTTLYTQGDIIRVMKEKGIGRPSTYAKIIQTILNRRYVLESKMLKRLIPTSLGRRVYNYLIANYEDLVSEERTALLEKMMNDIESGEGNYQKVIEELHKEITSIK